MKLLSAWAITGTCVVTLGVAATLYSTHDRASERPPFTLAKIQRGDIVRSVATTGQLTPRVSVEVSSQISGLLTDVAVDFNTAVKKGQILARVDPSTYEQTLQQENANLAAARAAYALAELNAERMKGLRALDLVTQQDWDMARAQREQSKAILLTSVAAVRNARVNLERCTIISPIDGVVIFKQAEVGKTVVSSFSAPTLFVIAQDLSHMRILAPIAEIDVRWLHIGQQVAFTVDALPGRAFHGILTQLRAPYLPTEKQTQGSPQNTTPTFESVIDVENPEFILQPSLTANVSIIVARSKNVLRIPNSALRVKLPEEFEPLTPSRSIADTIKPGFAAIYVLPDGSRDARPRLVQARLGITDSLVTELVDGLREGDTVITGVAVMSQGEERALFN